MQGKVSLACLFVSILQNLASIGHGFSKCRAKPLSGPLLNIASGHLNLATMHNSYHQNTREHKGFHLESYEQGVQSHVNFP